MAYRINTQQERLARQILGVGQRMGATKKEQKAAIQTALVEANLSNPSGGDADSGGWRQERRSLYPNPTNVKDSATRFFKETRAVRGKYGRAGDLAAAVQRPAAQYRGRYQQKSAAAESVLKQVLRGGGGNSGRIDGTEGTPDSVIPGMDATTIPAGSTGGSDLLKQALAAPPTVTQTPPSDPTFTSRSKLATPVGSAGLLQPSMPPVAPASDITDQLDAVRGLGQTDTVIPGTPDVTIPGREATEGGSGGGSLPGGVKNVVADMNRIDRAKVPYKWGGGHGAKQPRGSKVTPLDCSGAVSRVLGINPRVSGQFTSWGKPGKAKRDGGITVYANAGHVLMSVRMGGKERFWGTSKSNPRGGAGWIPASAVGGGYLNNLTARHQ